MARPRMASVTAMAIPIFAFVDTPLDVGEEWAGVDGWLVEPDEVELGDIGEVELTATDRRVAMEKPWEDTEAWSIVTGLELELDVIDEGKGSSVVESGRFCNNDCGDGASKESGLGNEQSNVPEP